MVVLLQPVAARQKPNEQWLHAEAGPVEIRETAGSATPEGAYPTVSVNYA
jgi:hypothetical protein